MKIEQINEIKISMYTIFFNLMTHEVKGNYLWFSLKKETIKFKKLKGINDQMKEFCLIRILEEITESRVGRKGEGRERRGKEKVIKETMNENFP